MTYLFGVEIFISITNNDENNITKDITKTKSCYEKFQSLYLNLKGFISHTNLSWQCFVNRGPKKNLGTSTQIIFKQSTNLIFFFFFFNMLLNKC
jgi:hypothetical protein